METVINMLVVLLIGGVVAAVFILPRRLKIKHHKGLNMPIYYVFADADVQDTRLVWTENLYPSCKHQYTKTTILCKKRRLGTLGFLSDVFYYQQNVRDVAGGKI